MVKSYRHLGVINASQPHVWSRSFSAKKFFSTKNLIGQEPYSADVGTNPTEGAHFEVGIVSGNNTDDPGTFTLRAEIDYIAMMSEPKIADAS